MKIIIVEDDSSLRFTLQLSLEEHGHEVHAFGDLYAFQEFLRNGAPFDLLITDFNLLPDGDGLQVVEAARAETPNFRIIVISGSTEKPERLKKLIGMSGVEFFRKPFEIEVLLNIIQKKR